MPRHNLNDLLALVTVARERSFTRAAARLDVTQSALSHTIRNLEARLGVRLLTRTTRSVSTTDAGERLIRSIGPKFDEIEADLSAVAELGERPAGTIRITSVDHPIDAIIWPRLAKVLPQYPDLNVELTVDYGLTNIVGERYDIGVRFGDQIEKDMIAVRISPDVKMAIAASPAYFKGRDKPMAPRDLLSHRCINLRLSTSGGLYAWELAKGSKKVQARVEGQVVCNSVNQMLNAALDGFGLVFLPLPVIQPYADKGKLVKVMEDWCPTFPGYHAFYPSRRQSSRALKIVIDAIRHKPDGVASTKPAKAGHG
ncbi:LysR family transcriptional regulator [Cupriavidus sp. H18C2]|uniref:LysR family transcriptional regulator n=1 Tax=Cupriavidus sp. H18C2 TaxID=3241602 RepID=UPI003BF7C9DC